MLQIARLSPKLLGDSTQLVADFVESQLNEDGGFCDRDGRSDLYALGVLLFELLTGAPPYRARSVAGIGYKHLHAPMPDLPRGYQNLQGLLNRLMAKSPAKRFRDAATAAQAIDLLMDSLPE